MTIQYYRWTVLGKSQESQESSHTFEWWGCRQPASPPGSNMNSRLIFPVRKFLDRPSIGEKRRIRIWLLCGELRATLILTPCCIICSFSSILNCNETWFYLFMLSFTKYESACCWFIKKENFNTVRARQLEVVACPWICNRRAGTLKATYFMEGYRLCTVRTILKSSFEFWTRP